MAGRPTIYASPMSDRERQKRHRDKVKAEKAKTSPEVDDPVAALAEWAQETLLVPPGHPLAGKPMSLPDFAIDFLTRSWSSHESALCVARKNGKSAVIAILVLGYLVGPLRQPGWRGCVCSVSLAKAAELRAQVVSIAEASGLVDLLKVRKSPYPGSIEAIGSGSVFDTLSSDRAAGHASGFDLVLVDETGLFPERSRDLLAGLRSSVSAKGGRVLHLSVRGDSPLYREILDNPATTTAIYEAAAGCDLDDVTSWRAANPGLGVIKSIDYMNAEVVRLDGAPGDEPSFRAFDLNQELDPAAEMIVPLETLKQCFVDDGPDALGYVYLGFDFGEATSLTAAVAVWPQTGLMRTWLACGDNPSLRARSKIDSANYVEMQTRGELKTYPGRVVPVSKFLADVASDLDGHNVAGAAADSYKQSETQDALERAGIRWPITFRRVGAGRDGGRDIRAFQRLCHQQKIKLKVNLSLTTAISKATIHRDSNGNPGLKRAYHSGRIDVLSAAVIAVGLAESAFDKPVQRRRFI